MGDDKKTWIVLFTGPALRGRSYHSGPSKYRPVEAIIADLHGLIQLLTIEEARKLSRKLNGDAT